MFWVDIVIFSTQRFRREHDLGILFISLGVYESGATKTIELPAGAIYVPKNTALKAEISRMDYS